MTSHSHPVMTPGPPTLDHIVILVPHTTLETLSTTLKDHFIIAPGGKHNNGLTWNKLVLFPDGVYLEFIAFYDTISPSARKSHRWGNLRENTIIDWAFTSTTSTEFNAIRHRVSVQAEDTQISYEVPAEWSRKREDGVLLEWTLSTPVADPDSGYALPPGRLPFWCIDTTPRSLRVPYKESPELTRHPSGVRGVASLHLGLGGGDDDDEERVATVFDALAGPSQGAAGDWKYRVPEGESGGVLLSKSAETPITLTLWGSEEREIEVLPGLVFHVTRS